MSKNHHDYQSNLRNEHFLENPYGDDTEITQNYSRMYRRNLNAIAVSSFAWENLPLEIPIRVLERYLYLDGRIVFTYDKGLEKYILLRMGAVLERDLYGYPQKYYAHAFFGDGVYPLTNKDSVIIYDSVVFNNSYDNTVHHANNLMQIRKTMNSVLFCMRTPYILQSSSISKLTILNIFKQMQEFKPAIFLKKFKNENNQFSKNDISVLNTDIPNIEKRLQILRLELKEEFSEALRDLGVASYIDTKKERLVKDEVSASLGGAFAMRNPRLSPRLEAARQINEMFGLDIAVSYDSGLSSLIRETEKNIIGEEDS